MGTAIRVIAELSIAIGKAQEVKSQMPSIIENVKSTEKDILGYEWYINKDETKCYIHEWFRNSEALLAHLETVGPALPALFAIAPITKWEMFGDLSPAIAETIIPIGMANNVIPIINKYLSGFTR